MKYGMPTLAEFNSILENVNLAKENNFDFIELNMDLPYSLEIENISLKEYNIEFTMHLSEELNVADLNDCLRKKYLEEAIRQIKLGISQGIKKYNLHIDSGIYFTMPKQKLYLNDKYLELYKKALQESCQILDELAFKNNIQINFENTKFHDFTKEAIKIIGEYANLGFTLDIGHNEKNGNKAYSEFKKEHKINHIHLHDYNGQKDHIEVGKGNINFKNYEEVIKSNYVVIEVKEKNELIASLNYLKDLFN